MKQKQDILTALAWTFFVAVCAIGIGNSPTLAVSYDSNQPVLRYPDLVIPKALPQAVLGLGGKYGEKASLIYREMHRYEKTAAFGTFMAHRPSGGGGGGLIMPAANDVSANWGKAGLLTIGGIPTRSTICTTLNPSGVIPPNTGDDATLLNAAIASCPAGQVILFNTSATKYNYAQSQLPIILNKGITLRGAGSPVGTCDASLVLNTPCWGAVLQTYDGPQPTYQATPQCGVTIQSTSACPNGSGFIQVAPQGLFQFGWGSTGQNCSAAATSINPTTASCGTTLTADAAQGDTTVTVTSNANFSVGMWVLIDEAPVLGTVTNPVPGQASIQASAEFLNSTITPVVGKIASPDGGNCTYSFCVNRVTQELHKITNIAGNVITFDSPLTIAFRQSGSHDARLYWPTFQTSNTANPFLQQAGIENLTINRVNGGGINFEFCSLCWVSNVEINYWIGGAVNFTYTSRSLVTGSFLHNCIDCQNNGNEYPIGLSTASTENLVDNNIVTFGGKCMVGRAAAANVVGYNYLDKHMYEVGVIGDYFLDMCANTSHYAGTHHNLLEGNWATNCDGDETHGNQTNQTFFRNQCSGLRTPFTDPSNGLAVNDCNGVGYFPSFKDLAIASATYNSGTGVIVVTLTGSSGTGYSSGTKVTLQALTGTGANIFNLNGTWNASSVSGQVVTLAGPTGQGSITINGGQATGNLPNAPGPLRAGGPMAFGYWLGFVANVLGQSGMQSCSVGPFIYNGTLGSSQTNPAIWISGWTGGEWNTLLDANLKVANSSSFIFRNGNFDYVNNSIFDNAAGYAHTFPNSLYLASSGASPPSWWPSGSTTYPFPWIDSTSGTPVKSNSLAGSGLPAKARADAGTPFNQP